MKGALRRLFYFDFKKKGVTYMVKPTDEQTRKRMFDEILDELAEDYIQDLVFNKTVQEVVELSTTIYLIKALSLGFKQIIARPDSTDIDFIQEYFYLIVQSEIDTGVPLFDEDYLDDVYMLPYEDFISFYYDEEELI